MFFFQRLIFSPFTRKTEEPRDVWNSKVRKQGDTNLIKGKQVDKDYLCYVIVLRRISD